MLLKMCVGGKNLLPNKSIFLNHFNDSVFTDSITNQQYTKTGVVDLDAVNKKFGAGSAKLSAGSKLTIPNTLGMTIQSNFTISFWVRDALNIGDIYMLGILGQGYTVSKTTVSGIRRWTFHIDNLNELEISADSSTGWFFVRCGVNNGEQFLIVNGIKTTRSCTVSPTITTDDFKFGYSNTYEFWVDEFLFQNGYGDDSTEIPIKEWG